jgi:hypothetical protein
MMLWRNTAEIRSGCGMLANHTPPLTEQWVSHFHMMSRAAGEGMRTSKSVMGQRHVVEAVSERHECWVVIGCMSGKAPTVCSGHHTIHFPFVVRFHIYLFCFVLNQHRSRPNKTYAGQKKSQILSSWTKPPFEAPQSLLSPNPPYARSFHIYLQPSSGQGSVRVQFHDSPLTKSVPLFFLFVETS